MRSPIRLLLTGLLAGAVWLSAPSGVLGSLSRSLNLEELTARADRVFLARCIGVRTEHDARIRQTVTRLTFAVQRSAKGNPSGTVTIRVLGSQDGSGGRGPIAGIPRFRQGETVLLFLYGDSALGLTSPVGLGNGKFQVLRDKHGRSLAVNEVGNENLLRGLSAAAERRLGEHARQWRGRKGIPPERLLEMVELLTGEDE